jgi:DNA-binding transcriptional regulator YdaS (Cro superfamily)
MKNQSVKENTAELKKEIKKTFESMIQDVMKGKVSIQEFTQKINYNYAQKKMEISGTLF